VAGAGIRARLDTIDVYGPPYLDVAGSWTRYGVATIAVTAQIIRTVGTSETILAQRTIRAVVNETPYPGPSGPLQSCNDLNYGGSFKVHWGTATASGPGPTDVPNNINSIAASIPREVPPSSKVDWLMGQNDAAVFAAMKANLESGVAIEDPWFRLISGATIDDFAASPSPQVFTPTAPYNPDHSNIFQEMSGVGCPEFDYLTWKTVANSGGSDVHYYKWVTGDQFSESGTGPATEFRLITGGQTGLYFFDTKDASEPFDSNGDGIFENLTPTIDLQGGSWGGMRGLLYVNTETFALNGTNNHGMNADFTLPGEPYRDANSNGVYDSGEAYINLNYNALANKNDTIRGGAGDRYPASNASATPVSRNAQGPTFVDKALFWGVLYNAGEFDSQGNPVYLGSVISKTGQKNSAGTPDLYWDPKLLTDWPPAAWALPRVIITRWETDL
jgi:hypothetical protein